MKKTKRVREAEAAGRELPETITMSASGHEPIQMTPQDLADAAAGRTPGEQPGLFGPADEIINAIELEQTELTRRLAAAKESLLRKQIEIYDFEQRIAKLGKASKAVRDGSIPLLAPDARPPAAPEDPLKEPSEDNSEVGMEEAGYRLVEMKGRWWIEKTTGEKKSASRLQALDYAGACVEAWDRIRKGLAEGGR